MKTSILSQELIQEIIKKYIDKVTIVDLSKEYNISKSYIYRLIKQNHPKYNRYKKEYISLREVEKLRQTVKSLQTENEIFRQSNCCLRMSNKEKIAVVEKLKDKFSVYAICKTIGLLKSTYYHYIKRAPKQKWYEKKREELRPEIIKIFNDSKERFGVEKILVKLRQKNYIVGFKVVSEIMKEEGLICKQSQLRQYNTTNKFVRYRKNRLKYNFNQEHPNIFWVSDITYMSTVKEDCYICVIIDLFSRKIISYKVSNFATTDFLIDTFLPAWQNRDAPPNLTFHSDQGSQYTSFKFRKTLRDLGVKQSYSCPGTPYDNAVAEAFFSTMKRETLSHKIYKDLNDLKNDVDEYVNFFNRERPFKKLGNLTPIEYEREYYLKTSLNTQK